METLHPTSSQEKQFWASTGGMSSTIKDDGGNREMNKMVKV